METRIPLKEARSHFEDLLRRVEAGENIIITRAGRDLAQLRRIEAEGGSNRLPSLKEWRSSIEVDGTSLSNTVLEQREEERY